MSALATTIPSTSTSTSGAGDSCRRTPRCPRVECHDTRRAVGRAISGRGSNSGREARRPTATITADCTGSFRIRGPCSSARRNVYPLTVKIVSWNVRRSPESWRILAAMAADVALLQEAAKPPQDVAGRVDVDETPWSTAGTDASRPWRTAVARLSQRVTVEWIEGRSLEDATGNDLAVSRPGSLAVARVSAPDIEPFFAVSMYSLWSRPHASTGSSWILSDVSCLTSPR